MVYTHATACTQAHTHVHMHFYAHTQSKRKWVRGGWSSVLILPVCLCSLQEKNSVLALENETQREQYERCLDEVKITLGNLEAS